MQPYPSVVLLDTTNLCNARCPFCPLFVGEFQFDRKARPASVMALDLYEKILCEIADWERKPSEIITSANGEILQDPLLFERLSLLKRTGLARRTVLLTNAQLLGDRAQQAILEAGIGNLIIGFEGATKETYEAHRVRCSYERVLGNIKAFVAKRAAIGGRTRIEIKFVRTTQNEGEVNACHAMFSQFMDTELDRFHDCLAVDWSNGDLRELNYYYVHKTSSGQRLNSCHYFDSGLQIQPDGMIAACCWDYNLDVSGGGLGNLAMSTVLDVWRGRNRALFAERLRSPATTPHKCSTCFILYEQTNVAERMDRISSDYLETRTSNSLLYRYA